MVFVGSAAGDGVDDAAHGAAEFGGIAVAENLKLLNGVLGNLGGDSGASGILAIEAIGGVVAVGHEGVASRDAVETDQPEGTVASDAGSEKAKVSARRPLMGRLSICNWLPDRLIRSWCHPLLRQAGDFDGGGSRSNLEATSRSILEPT